MERTTTMGRAREIIVKVLPSKIANDFIKKNHYSGKVVPNSCLHFGAFLDDKLHGVLSFGPSLDKRKIMQLVEGTGWNEFLELNRMAFDDHFNLCRLPNGEKIHKITLENNASRPRKELGGRSYAEVTGGRNFRKYVEFVGGEILKGFQLRYIYFLDKKKCRSKLKCKEIPFSEIDKFGAGMYKGEKITREERNVQCDAQKKFS